jgi:hypothetical protein
MQHHIQKCVHLALRPSAITATAAVTSIARCSTISRVTVPMPADLSVIAAFLERIDFHRLERDAIRRLPRLIRMASKYGGLMARPPFGLALTTSCGKDAECGAHLPLLHANARLQQSWFTLKERVNTISFSAMQSPRNAQCCQRMMCYV